MTMQKATILRMMDRPGIKGQVHRSSAMWATIAQQFDFKNMEDLLNQWYVKEELTTSQCAQRFKDNFIAVSRGRVRQLLKLCNIPRRSPGRLPTHVVIEGLDWSKPDRELANERNVTMRTMQRWREIARRGRD